MADQGPVCVSVINMKGGVGKTTTVALLGRHAAYNDVRVLAVDLDPQANLSQAYMGSSYRRFLESEEPSGPEYFATVGFPMLARSLRSFRTENPSHRIDVIGVVINNGFYDGGNNGGPEKRRAMPEIFEEAAKNGWHVFENEILHSRGYPKLMRGDSSWTGNAAQFVNFADEFFAHLEI